MPPDQTPLWVVILQAVGPPLIAAVAIVAACIVASGFVRAQRDAQVAISQRESNRQERIDRAVRAQIIAILANVVTEIAGLIDRPYGISLQRVTANHEKLSSRIYDLDVALAFEPDVLETLLRYHDREAEISSYLQDLQKESLVKSETPVQYDDILARVRWSAHEFVDIEERVLRACGRPDLADFLKNKADKFDSKSLLDDMVARGHIRFSNAGPETKQADEARNEAPAAGNADRGNGPSSGGP